MINVNKLIVEIERIRNFLDYQIMHSGRALSDVYIVSISKKLDSLLNIYNQLMLSNREKV